MADRTDSPAARYRERFSSAKLARWERRALWLLAAYLAAVCALLLLSGELRTGLAEVTLWVWPAALGLATVGFLLRTARWIVLARCAGLRVRAGSLAAVYLSGFPLTLTPGRVGELWRAWLMKRRYRSPVRAVLPLIAADRLLDLNVLALFAALIAWPGALAYALCAALIILPAAGLAQGGRLALAAVKGLWGLAGKRSPRKAAFLSATARGLTAALSWKLYVPLLALSALAWGMEAAAIIVVIDALGGTLAIAEAASALGLANIAGVLTLLPGGIGGQEATMGALLIAAGNAAAIATLTVAIVRICGLWYSIALGAPFLIFLSARSSQANSEPMDARGAAEGSSSP